MLAIVSVYFLLLQVVSCDSPQPFLKLHKKQCHYTEECFYSDEVIFFLRFT